MNTTYTLIKNPDGSFFLHGERCDSVLTKHWVFLEDGNSYTLIGATFGQEYGYPTLTFDEVVAREIGIIDIDKMAWDFMMSIHPSDRRDNEYALYKNIYNKFLNDNKDKVYTKDDFLLFALSLFGHIQRNPKSVTENIKEFVINYTIPNPTQWQVQIEMEQYTQNLHKDIWYNRPKITNNSIKVTKIV